jgi:hypothetical protein
MYINIFDFQNFVSLNVLEILILLNWSHKYVLKTLYFYFVNKAVALVV